MIEIETSIPASGQGPERDPPLTPATAPRHQDGSTAGPPRNKQKEGSPVHSSPAKKKADFEKLCLICGMSNHGSAMCRNKDKNPDSLKPKKKGESMKKVGKYGQALESLVGEITKIAGERDAHREKMLEMKEKIVPTLSPEAKLKAELVKTLKSLDPEDQRNFARFKRPSGCSTIDSFWTKIDLVELDLTEWKFLLGELNHFITLNGVRDHSVRGAEDREVFWANAKTKDSIYWEEHIPAKESKLVLKNQWWLFYLLLWMGFSLPLLTLYWMYNFWFNYWYDLASFGVLWQLVAGVRAFWALKDHCDKTDDYIWKNPKNTTVRLTHLLCTEEVNEALSAKAAVDYRNYSLRFAPIMGRCELKSVRHQVVVSRRKSNGKTGLQEEIKWTDALNYRMYQDDPTECPVAIGGLLPCDIKRAFPSSGPILSGSLYDATLFNWLRTHPRVSEHTRDFEDVRQFLRVALSTNGVVANDLNFEGAGEIYTTTLLMVCYDWLHTRNQYTRKRDGPQQWGF
jgi:hypothetical protein